MVLDKQQSLPAPRQLRPLHKQMSWSPDSEREELWLRKKMNYSNKRKQKSVTDDDLDELKACFELGFGFDNCDSDQKLIDTLPALEFYCTVNKQYSNSLSRSSSSSSILSDTSSTSSSSSIVDPGDDPETVKMRLKQWATVVACSVRQNSGKFN
ncbi:uncharacterized protein LOC126660909 [Mercurialis annua]|uniref:uncharacterized protein LOC126660909 n=1 Tax=Mercurialis annua TaxID=3986 RepID=UPI0021601BDF|nr:uncharacterized protein LOC126660909 [Mercurialis annua]